MSIVACLVFSFVTKSLHEVDSGGTARRYVTGEQRGAREDDRHQDDTEPGQ